MIGLLVGWCAVSGLTGAGVAVAAVAESRFTISPDGAHVDFSVREVPRRDVLERLFADRGIKLEWLDRAFADESISGTFKGTPNSVARNLLERANFVIVYGRRDDAFQISRIVVIGRAEKGRVSPGLAAIAAAGQPGASRPLPPKPSPAPAAREQVAPPQGVRLDTARASQSPPRLQSSSAAPTPGLRSPSGPSSAASMAAAAGPAGSTPASAAGTAGPTITASATPPPVPTPVPANVAGPTLTPAPPGMTGPLAAPAGSNGPVPFPVQTEATGP
jgi:hypothetical protein